MKMFLTAGLFKTPAHFSCRRFVKICGCAINLDVSGEDRLTGFGKRVLLCLGKREVFTLCREVGFDFRLRA